MSKVASSAPSDFDFLCVGVQIANSNPLVSDRQDLAVLQREYAEEDTVYQLKIKVSQTAPAALRLLHPHPGAFPPQVQGVILISVTKNAMQFYF